MLSFEEIKNNYPAKLKGSLFAQHMIKEYLQTLVLGRIRRSRAGLSIGSKLKRFGQV